MLPWFVYCRCPGPVWPKLQEGRNFKSTECSDIKVDLTFVIYGKYLFLLPNISWRSFYSLRVTGKMYDTC